MFGHPYKILNRYHTRFRGLKSFVGRVSYSHQRMLGRYLYTKLIIMLSRMNIINGGETKEKKKDRIPSLT